jgi:hypothetical protein
VGNIKWILERQDGVVWNGFIWLRVGSELTSSIECWEILEQLSGWQLPKKG